MHEKICTSTKVYTQGSKTYLHAPINRVDLSQFGWKMSEWTETSPIYRKNCDSATEFLNQADFHPVLHQQKEKQIGEKVVTCKLTHVGDPTYLSDR